VGPAGAGPRDAGSGIPRWLSTGRMGWPKHAAYIYKTVVTAAPAAARLRCLPGVCRRCCRHCRPGPAVQHLLAVWLRAFAKPEAARTMNHIGRW